MKFITGVEVRLREPLPLPAYEEVFVSLHPLEEV